ncbi:TonB-dependent receptor plug domain-containing protein [Xanthomonas populi]|uniref:TonB-dependent receptor plug domain-containing protein n=1 Tax=Xanthomonas populi TaxID=53414 RepID=UPI001FC98C09|nr:TonB-dependent receptor plug domain-containing protein [Xanthomonas populi]
MFELSGHFLFHARAPARSPLSAAVRGLLLGGAAVASAVALPAFAQEQPAPAAPQAPAQTNPSVSTLDEIKVVGYQASLGKAFNVKRNADAIVDAISAEDIGKFPVTNVAESLSRLSGITVDRKFGEGETVSILGTDPALNRVLINGQTIASTSWGRRPQRPGQPFVRLQHAGTGSGRLDGGLQNPGSAYRRRLDRRHRDRAHAQTAGS